MIIVSTTKNSIVLILLLSLTFACSSKKRVKLEEQELVYAELPDRFLDSTTFQSYLLDFNHDGRTDRAFAHAAFQGDSLFIFKKTESGYVLSLETLNLTGGGLFFVVDLAVEPQRAGFSLQTMFNGAGALRQTYYFAYNNRNNSWMLNYTVIKVETWNSKGLSHVKTCKIQQGIELNGTTQWRKMRDINEAYDRECKTISMQ
jgi:hypothetical protein